MYNTPSQNVSFVIICKIACNRADIDRLHALVRVSLVYMLPLDICP